MLLSRKVGYAIRAILCLAASPEQPKMARQISTCQGIPKPFLIKILQELADRGLVKSHRGIKGGFSLRLPPSKITFFDVVEAVEGKISVNKCLLGDLKCGFRDKCELQNAWSEIRADIAQSLKSKNLGGFFTAHKKAVTQRKTTGK